MHLELWQWGFGIIAALLVGISKTGVPGMGILVVPLLAAIFGGRASIGIMLPMLIISDCFAVAWYRRHAEFDKLIKLFPWIVVGMVVGSAALWKIGDAQSGKDIMNTLIGVVVLSMMGLSLLQSRLGDRMSPRSKFGIASTGASAGFATTVSNAAGSIMSMYLMALNMPKAQFMGTISWYFFIVNLSKLPIYIGLTAMNPQKPIVTLHSMSFVLTISPAIILGVFIGKWLLPRIPQKLFESVILVLAAVAALKLIFFG